MRKFLFTWIPSPLWGEGWGEGNSRQRSALTLPSPACGRGGYVVLSIVLAGAAGCAFDFSHKNQPVPGMGASARQTDLYAHESHTLSALATLETGVNDYVRNEGRIPDKLEDLIPKYLAEIPRVELGHSDIHGDTAAVEYYRGRVIQNGALDSSQLKDTGGWGYVHNDHQVIVFVDCTHANSRGRPWYMERGAF